MSDKICFISLQSKSDLDKLGYILLENYNKNIETTLNKRDEDLLNKVAEQFEELLKKSNVKFNSEGFKSFIKRIYVYNLEQYGGDDDEIVTYSLDKVNSYSGRSSIAKTIVADFIALLGFFISVFLFFIAYQNLISITQGMTGYIPVEVGQEVMDQYHIAIEEVRRLNTSQLSWLQFFYQIFSTFGCSIVESNIANIQLIILNGLQNSFRGISTRVTTACLITSEAPSSIGMFASLLNFASAPSTTSTCVNERIKIETSLIQAQVTALQDSLFLEISTRAQQISGNITLSLQIGIPCTTYLMARIVYVTTPIIRRIGNSMTKNGGNRKKNTKKNNKKNTRKNKKHRKTYYRKNKKNSKKHIKKQENYKIY